MFKTSCVISHFNELVFITGRRMKATADLSYQISLHMDVTTGLGSARQSELGRDRNPREGRTS